MRDRRSDFRFDTLGRILNRIIMLQRHLGVILAADPSPAVTLVGPRQSGKTTLVRAVFPDHAYVSLEPPDQRRLALDDPRGFLAGLGDRDVILDEVQRAPALLSYVQERIDAEAHTRGRSRRRARFVLTGSQNLLLLASVSQTLAGRPSVHRLLPLSVSELLGRPPIDPLRLDHLDAVPRPCPLERWDTVFRGLYPRVHDEARDPTRWYADYYRTYVERDLRDVLRVMDLELFDRFVRAVAASTGQELVLASLASDAGITLPTAKSWLGALEVGFVATRLPSHHESYRRRLRKHPKVHFLDTGLACYLLGIRSAEQLAHHPLRGALFESFVVSEIRKAFEHAGRDAPLSFWRDASRREVDLLVDAGDRVLPVEIKSGMTVASDAFDPLRAWNAIAGQKTGVLVHGGEQALEQHGLVVRPWFLA
jgi:predicted AAA+ superfamily ATPase